MTTNTGKKRMHRMHTISHTHHGFSSEPAIIISNSELLRQPTSWKRIHIAFAYKGGNTDGDLRYRFVLARPSGIHNKS